IAGSQSRNPNRNRDTAELLAGRALHECLAPDDAADVLADRAGLREPGSRKQDHELLPAIARGHILALYVLFEGTRDETEHLVASEMAEGVIHIFEVINVDHQQR